MISSAEGRVALTVQPTSLVAGSTACHSGEGVHLCAVLAAHNDVRAIEGVVVGPARGCSRGIEQRRSARIRPAQRRVEITGA